MQTDEHKWCQLVPSLWILTESGRGKASALGSFVVTKTVNLKSSHNLEFESYVLFGGKF